MFDRLLSAQLMTTDQVYSEKAEGKVGVKQAEWTEGFSRDMYKTETNAVLL